MGNEMVAVRLGLLTLAGSCGRGAACAMTEEGVVGCVESSSEGACEVKGVSRLLFTVSGISRAAASNGGVCIASRLSSVLSGPSRREGNSTGTLGDCGTGFLRRRLELLGGNVPSVNEYHGSFFV